MTGRCYDFPGPAEPVIATSDGWLPLTEDTAVDVARSAMFLACSPEHLDGFHDTTAQPAVAAAVGSVDPRR